MNILLVCNKFPFPPRDGGSLASYNMIKGLAEEGNRVDLLAMNTSRHYSSVDISSVHISGLEEIRGVYIDNSVRLYGLICNLLFSRKPYNAERFINGEFGKTLAEMVQENCYDLVQLEGLYLLHYVRIIRENTDARIVYRAHNVEHNIWEGLYKRERNIFRKWYLGVMFKRIRRFERDMVNSYDLLVPLTKRDLELYNVLGNTKEAFISPFGMYTGSLPGTDYCGRGGPCLQYIGALDWLPNIEALDWFIEKVWRVLKKRHPQLRFCVAGRNAEKNYAGYLVSQGIDFMGEVEDASEFITREGIIVVPLFSGSGMRVRIIEAMFLGKPVIATSLAVSGIPVENGKNLMIADDDYTFEESIERLLADREYASILGRNAGKFSRKYYNNRVIARELTEFLKKHLL